MSLRLHRRDKVGQNAGRVILQEARSAGRPCRSKSPPCGRHSREHLRWPCVKPYCASAISTSSRICIASLRRLSRTSRSTVASLRAAKSAISSITRAFWYMIQRPLGPSMRCHASAGVAFTPSFHRNWSLKSRALQSTRRRDNSESHDSLIRRRVLARQCARQITTAANQQVGEAEQSLVTSGPDGSNLRNAPQSLTVIAFDVPVIPESGSLCQRNLTDSSDFLQFRVIKREVHLGNLIALLWDTPTFEYAALSLQNRRNLVKFQCFGFFRISSIANRSLLAAPATVSSRFCMRGLNSCRGASFCTKLYPQ